MLKNSFQTILLRKSLKSIANQIKLNLIKKIKQANKLGKNASKKEEELSCFKRLNLTEIPLSHGLHPEKLQKTLTDRFSSEIDRLHARILLSPIIQRTLVKMKEAKGLELTEKFLQRNEKKVKLTVIKKIDQEVEDKIEKSEKVKEKVKVKDKKEKKKETVNKPGAFVRNPNFRGDISSDEEDPVPKSVDPFFLSTSGNNYLAAVTTADISENVEDEEEQPPKKRFKHINFDKINRTKRQIFKNVPKIQEKLPQMKILQNNTTKEDEIHPSWAAKQQQKKLQVQEFQGTKIKFDD